MHTHTHTPLPHFTPEMMNIFWRCSPLLASNSITSYVNKPKDLPWKAAANFFTQHFKKTVLQTADLKRSTGSGMWTTPLIISLRRTQSPRCPPTFDKYPSPNQFYKRTRKIWNPFLPRCSEQTAPHWSITRSHKPIATSTPNITPLKKPASYGHMPTGTLHPLHATLPTPREKSQKTPTASKDINIRHILLS